MAGRVRIRDSLAFGWRTFRRNTLFFIVLLVVLGIPLAILGALVGKIPPAGADPSRLFLELALCRCLFESPLHPYTMVSSRQPDRS